MTKARLLLAGAIALGCAAAPAAAQYSTMVFFGDSLSDAGSYKPLLPAGIGLFTTNPGPVWPQFLGAEYGFAITPANQGGTDYAYGGARVVLTPGYPAQPPTASAVPIATQVQQAIGRGIDGNGVYFVWGGANDLFTGLTALQAGQISQTQLQAALGLAATQVAQQVAVLSNAGARYLVVFNLPDIGRTPAFLGSAQSASVSALSGFFNTTLNGALDSTGIATMRVDIATLLGEIAANPSRYGFANATSPACGATPSLQCTAANFVTPNAQESFVFADGVHPTTAGHRVIAQVVDSMLTGPAQAASLGEAPLAVEQAAFRTVDARMWSALGTPVSPKRSALWVSYDYAQADIDGTGLSGDADLHTIAVGGDTRLSQHLLFGGAFNYSESKGRYDGGGYKLEEASGTVYVGYGGDRWYVGTSLLVGNLDYPDIHRSFALGAAERRESGRASGWHAALRAHGGYWFSAGDTLLHGPFVKLTYQEAHVKGFSETGASSTALRYDEQTRESLQGTFGWQAHARLGSVRPFARVSWEVENEDDVRTVTAHSVTQGGSYTVAGFRPDDNWLLWQVGASTDFGQVTGYLMGSGTTSKRDGDYFPVTLGIRVPL